MTRRPCSATNPSMVLQWLLTNILSLSLSYCTSKFILGTGSVMTSNNHRAVIFFSAHPCLDDCLWSHTFVPAHRIWWLTTSMSVNKLKISSDLSFSMEHLSFVCMTMSWIIWIGCAAWICLVGRLDCNMAMVDGNKLFPIQVISLRRPVLLVTLSLANDPPPFVSVCVCISSLFLRVFFPLYYLHRCLCCPWNRAATRCSPFSPGLFSLSLFLRLWLWLLAWTMDLYIWKVLLEQRLLLINHWNRRRNKIHHLIYLTFQSSPWV